MAKKDNIGLLTEIVGQLRTLNRHSVRDQLRENEAIKRQEALTGQTEEQTEGQGLLISDAQDFQRRFIAGQAKTFTDKALQKQGSKLDEQVKIREAGELGTDFLASIGAELMHVRQILEGPHKTLPDLSRPIEGPLLENVNPAIDVETARHTLEMQESLKLLEHHATKEGSLFVADVNLLDYFKGRDDELDRQRNTDLRSAEERRREMIRLAGKGAGGMGAGMDGMDEDGGGTFLGKLWSNKGDIAKGVGAGAGLLWWRKIAGWFGYKNDSLLKRIVFRMQLWGEWLRNKFGGRALRANPTAAAGLRSGNRFIMIGAVATLVAWTFWDNILSAFNLQEEEEKDAADQFDTIDSSAQHQDIDPHTDSGGPSLHTAVTTGFVLQFLSSRQWTQRIAQQMANNIFMRYATAPNGTWQHRMFQAMKSGKLGVGTKLTRIVAMGSGRAFMAAFGPWGLLAYTVWAIADWKMAEAVAIENSAALWLKDDAKDFRTMEELEELRANTYSADFAKPMKTGDVTADLERMKATKKRVLDLMRGQSQENLEKIFQILDDVGWTTQDIVEFINILKNEKIGDLSSLNIDKLNGLGTNGQTSTLLASLGKADTRELGQLASAPAMIASKDSHDMHQYNSTSIYVLGRKVQDWTSSNYSGVATA